MQVKRVALSRTVSAADTLSLERLIRDGPPDDDVGSALTNMRFKVLDQGIKSDMDGMVRLSRGTNKQAVWSLKLTMFSPLVGYTSG
jgi:hypothetical protein